VTWGFKLSDYKFDIFLSYSRKGNVAEWLQRHFSEVLNNCLTDELGYPPRIFLDTRMETGSLWPAELENGLRTSRLMVAILSPPYWASKWCRTEWDTMAERERLTGYASTGNPRGLIYPFTFADGDKFPESAKNRQCRSMKKWGYPYRQFADSPAYLEFFDEVKLAAGELVARLEEIPPWSATWPIMRTGHVPTPVRATLPEL
jgi:hypothetical protein